MPRVTLVRSGETFDVAPDETIIEGAMDAEVFMAHNCLNGICRTCISRVISGVVEQDPERAPFLNIEASEIEAGWRLVCSAFARTDIELDK